MLLSEIAPLSDLIEAPSIAPALPRLPCGTCHVRSLNFCGTLLENDGDPLAMLTKHHAATARRNIYRAGEPAEGVLVICDGWAVRFVQLPNGKRQILSVVLPGDLVSPTSIFERQLSFSIQAVTDVRYCTLPFAEVRARIRDNPALFDVWLGLTAAEHRDADKRLVDLGQRAAQERIAALLVHIMTRFEERGEIQDDEFPFPMSQQQIADFTGLTPVHTCRVLSWLRKNGICDVGHGVVKVTERTELQRLAALK
jgi:CRP/FNR family transcriptional regulator, anaerobic regulatory protein